MPKFLAPCGVLSLLCFAAPLAAAQEFYEPSLPVPAPAEEIAEYKSSPEFYAVASNGQSPRPFDARRRAAEVAARKAREQTITDLRTMPPQTSGFYVKAGSFRSFENAQRLHTNLFEIGNAQITHREAKGLDFYGVYLGPWRTEAEAMEAFALALDKGMQDGAIIPPQ